MLTGIHGVQGVFLRTSGQLSGLQVLYSCQEGKSLPPYLSNSSSLTGRGLFTLKKIKGVLSGSQTIPIHLIWPHRSKSLLGMAQNVVTLEAVVLHRWTSRVNCVCWFYVSLRFCFFADSKSCGASTAWFVMNRRIIQATDNNNSKEVFCSELWDAVLRSA